MAYRCALKHPLFYRFGLIIDNIESDTFMRGLFNYAPPPRSAPMASWLLDDLLHFLLSDEFEPLESVSIRRLVQKTLVLLLLASGRRISEILGISGSSSRKGGLLFLDWLPGFRAKHDNRGFRPSCPSISAMGSERLADSLLCPVRAFTIFSERCSLASPSGVGIWPYSRSALSNLVTSVISEARVFAGRSDVVPGGPHHLRKFAASYSRAFLIRSPGQEKLLARRMGCKNLSVLKRVYIREVPPLEFSCVFPLGTLFSSH